MRLAVLVVASALGGGCVQDALLAKGSPDFPGSPTPVRHGSALEQEIAAGYSRYRASLASVGQWRPDEVYGIRWCPQLAENSVFVPYLTNGHWVPAAISPGTPYWENDAAAGGDITMHHGWWVHQEAYTPENLWCWIPGIEETPARVVWRVGDGFVGWAPEPPDTDPDRSNDDDDDDELLAWVFEFMGTLFDDVLNPALLTGPAAETAQAITRPSRARPRVDGHRPNRLGPSRSDVTAAREALQTYVVLHPAIAKPSDRPAAAGASATSSNPRLPPATLIYAQLAEESAGAAPRSGTFLPHIPKDVIRSSPAESSHATSGARGSSGFASSASGATSDHGSSRTSSPGHSASASGSSRSSSSSSSQGCFSAHSAAGRK
jgi:hypothetical protein